MSTAERELALLQKPKPDEKGSGNWASELFATFRNSLSATPYIPTGFDRQGLIDTNRVKIMEILTASENQWNDWRWQMANRTGSADLLAGVLNLTEEDTGGIKASTQAHNWSITPYYLSLMSPDPMCPIRQQVILPEGPQAENDRSRSAINRWRGILSEGKGKLGIIRVSGDCAVKCQYCVFCHKPKSQVTGADNLLDSVRQQVEHLRDNQRIGRILITGGDPLLLEDSVIQGILQEISSLKGISGILMESRSLAVLPQRITGDLADILSNVPHMTLITQFNSPLEVTGESIRASKVLLSKGISLQNRPYILSGVNDMKYITKRLRDVLWEIGYTHTRKRRA